MDTTKHPPAVLSFCTGYGGLEIGLRRELGEITELAHVEIEAFAIENLVAKMEAGILDAAPIWTDVKTFPAHIFRGSVDILTGGYPCQPFSAAGKRQGADDPRHLWPYIRNAINIIQPRICFFENVEGHISLGLSTVISDLEEDGYRTTWGIFSAEEVGAPHRRKRVFILAESKLSRSGGESRNLVHEGRPTSKAGTTGLPEATRWQDGVAEPDNKPASVNELAHRNSAGLEGLRECCNKEGWEAPIGHTGSSCKIQSLGNSSDVRLCRLSENPREAATDESREECRVYESERAGTLPRHEPQPFPARPSEPQYEWEPPRVVGDSRLQRQEKQEQRPAGAEQPNKRQVEPPLGRNVDGATCRMDYAELCVSCDNRTDELRLLGNGVVPATASLAWRTLIRRIL